MQPKSLLSIDRALLILILLAGCRSTENPSTKPKPTPNPAIAVVIGELEPGEWRKTVEDLAGFSTRFSGTPQVEQAASYLEARFSALGLAPARSDFVITNAHYSMQAVPATNIIAEIRGTSRPDDLYLVTAHYDSVSSTGRTTGGVPDMGQNRTLAPGAEDNGSGTAALVEAARIFAKHPPAATIRFVAFSGEEEGLYGSADYVSRLKASGELSRVKGLINMDMISFNKRPELGVLLETDRSDTPTYQALEEAAAAYTGLSVYGSLHPFGSDHVPFIQAGIPAVLVIQNDWDIYPYYHSPEDTPDKTSLPMATEIMKMVIGAVAKLSGAGVVSPGNALWQPLQGGKSGLSVNDRLFPRDCGCRDCPYLD